MNVTIRPWQIDDAEFVIKVRNNPELQRWFRQDFELTLEAQKQFMLDFGFKYRGYIVEADGVPCGLVALAANFCWVGSTAYMSPKSAEFGVAILPEYQRKGVATQAMNQLCKVAKDHFGAEVIWSEVFVDNPALSWYLRKLGFKAVSVKERAYYKKGVGLIDVVKIERRLA